MKIKPSKADEHGVRWCFGECEQCAPEDGNPASVFLECAITEKPCAARGLNPYICEPWVRRLLKASRVILDRSYIENVCWLGMSHMEALLDADEIEVEE